MKEIIPSDFAKQQLLKIDELLNEPHLLIGGLAVQQYHKNRDSSDIDLVCSHKTKSFIVENLFPTKNYKHEELNDDEYRPSFIATHKVNSNKIVFFGPKILEREPYQYLNWDNLLINSNAFIYQKKELKNIRIPKAEELAYSKLISFLSRFSINKDKGEKDLIDFINISNAEEFHINRLINLISINQCEKFIEEKLKAIGENIDYLWDKSMFIDLVKILSNSINFRKEIKEVLKDNFDKIYSVSDSEKFYNEIAKHYQSRNSSNLKKTHQYVAKSIMNDVKKSSHKKIKILDIGGGTGSIAELFFNYSNIEWHNVDYSTNMIDLFDSNLKNNSLEIYKHNINISKFSNKNFDYILLSFFLSSSNINFTFDIISKFCGNDTKIFIADFHPEQIENSPFFDFEINKKMIALNIKKIYPLDIINELSKNQYKPTSVKIIKNEIGKRYSFIAEFNLIKNYRTTNDYFKKINKQFLEEFTTDENKKTKTFLNMKKSINKLNSIPLWESINPIDLIGKYEIIGVNQDEERSEYNGILTLEVDENKKIIANWSIDNASQAQRGIGFYKNNILVINFEYEGDDNNIFKGVVVYNIISKNILNGFWSEKHGDQKYLGEEQCFRINTIANTVYN